MVFVVWFTGLPGSGKTTIAENASKILKGKGIDVKILHLDEIRKVITPSPKYTEEERDIVYASLAYMAKLLSDRGTNVFIDATGNKRRYRDEARELIPNFAEAYVKCPLKLCMEREAVRKSVFTPKDIYKGAIKKGAMVPGVNISYEEPLKPEIFIDYEKMTPEEGASLAAEEIINIFCKK